MRDYILIETIENLNSAIQAGKNNLEVGAEAFEFCDEIRREQVLGSGADWSIAATNGWLALITGFNHKIHRSFMSQTKRDREDLKHTIVTKYIIKKTETNDKYVLVLRK